MPFLWTPHVLPGTRQELYDSFLSTSHLTVPITFFYLRMGFVASEPYLGSPSYKEAEWGPEMLPLCHRTLCSMHTARPWNSEVHKAPHPTPRPGDLTEFKGRWCHLWLGLVLGLLSDNAVPWHWELSQYQPAFFWVGGDFSLGTKAHITSELRSLFWNIWMQPSCEAGPTTLARPWDQILPVTQCGPWKGAVS